MKLAILLEDLIPPEEFKRRLKHVFLTMQHLLIEGGADDADIKSDPYFGFRLTVAGKMRYATKKKDKVSFAVRFIQDKDGHHGRRGDVITTVDGARIFYRNDYDSPNYDDAWDSEENIQLAVKEILKILVRRTSPQVDKYSREGDLKHLEQTYKARWKKTPKLDGRFGVIISALKSPKMLYIYVANTKDNPHGGQAGYVYVERETLLHGREILTFIETEKELLDYVKRWVKENP